MNRDDKSFPIRPVDISNAGIILFDLGVLTFVYLTQNNIPYPIRFLITVGAFLHIVGTSLWLMDLPQRWKMLEPRNLQQTLAKEKVPYLSNISIHKGHSRYSPAQMQDWFTKLGVAYL